MINAPTTPEQLAEQRHQAANALLTMNEQMTPIFDAADGLRKDMLDRGWSAEAAEQIGLTWLIKVIQSLD
ncbi:hypothetical protein [Streptomyces sp. AD55]|uniref:hypothetical protein n=1 Tax=Streptomyces sp. AD55 TaxID=3242895 RepID=UPI003528C0F5